MLLLRLCISYSISEEHLMPVHKASSPLFYRVVPRGSCSVFHNVRFTQDNRFPLFQGLFTPQWSGSSVFYLSRQFCLLLFFAVNLPTRSDKISKVDLDLSWMWYVDPRVSEGSAPLKRNSHVHSLSHGAGYWERRRLRACDPLTR